MLRGLAVLLALGTVACSSPAADGRQPGAPGDSPAFLADCALPDVGGRVLCGTFEVPENREQPGRRIPLNIVVLKATGSDARSDPFVPLQGGPGQAATPLAAMYGRLFAGIRAQRDIVLVDVRGTGKSNPLHCDIASSRWTSSTDLMPLEAIRACRETLQQRADLRHYTTAEIAEDLDDVRRALKTEQWNLFGGSYGTRLAQEYTRMFPARVRTLTLHGVAAPSMAIPLPYARDAQAAADRLFDEETRAHLAAVLERLRRAPVIVPTPTGEVAVAAGTLSEALRHVIYNARSADEASAIIRDAANGNFVPAADAVVRQRTTFSGDIAMGMFLSVTCAEDIPRIDEAAIAAATAATFLGDYRVRQQMAACGEWPRGAARADAVKPLRSDVPALLISGEVDPVTPPRMGEEVARGLPNATHVVLARHGHTLAVGTPCLRTAIQKFIETAHARALDLSCVATVSRQ